MHQDLQNLEGWPLRENVFEFLKAELGERSQSIVVSMSNILRIETDYADSSLTRKSTEMIEIFVKTVKKCKDVEVFSNEFKNIFTKKRFKTFFSLIIYFNEYKPIKPFKDFIIHLMSKIFSEKS